MRVVCAFLLLLAACSGIRCPDGYVAAHIGEAPACVSVASYCEDDGQCSSARFDCARPCAHLPVNILFSSQAQEKAQLCGALNASCPQVPFVDNKCVAHQCVAVAHTAAELIPLPVFYDVAPNKSICYDVAGRDSVVKLHLHNNASMPLSQVEAIFNVSLANGSTAVMVANVLNSSLPSGDKVKVEARLTNATPIEAFLFAVRPVKAQGVAMGVRNNDLVAQAKVTRCSAPAGNV